MITCTLIVSFKKIAELAHLKKKWQSFPTWQDVMAVNTAVGEKVEQRQGAAEARHRDRLADVEP